MGGRGLRICVIFCCSFQDTSRELDQRWNSQDMSWDTGGTGYATAMGPSRLIFAINFKSVGRDPTVSQWVKYRQHPR